MSQDKSWPDAVIINTDGASRGNPGPASIGVSVLTQDGECVFECSRFLGVQTNNYAEYKAVEVALEKAAEMNVREVTLRSDSELLIRQLLGQYKVKSSTLRPLWQRCQELAQGFERIHFEHVRREYNKRADALANEALDGEAFSG